MVASNSHHRIDINTFILKLFAVMYTKMWFVSVLPEKYLDRTVK
jgi:hypothetical protein